MGVIADHIDLDAASSEPLRPVARDAFLRVLPHTASAPIRCEVARRIPDVGAIGPQIAGAHR